MESLINGERFEANDKIKVETTAKLHSGGPYVDAESRVTIKLKERPFTSSHPAAKNFNFLSLHTINRQSQIYQKSKKLNSNGISNQVYKLKDQKISYGKLYFESAVRDDRGKFVVSRKVATYLGVDKFVGLKNTKWTYQAGKKAEIEYLVVDPSGKPHEGNNVEIKIEYKKTFSSRVKGSGNAYVTKYTNKMITKSSCSGKSLKEKAVCSFVPDEAGEYKITAIVKDSKKRKHESSIWAWVTGNTHVVWESSTSNALTIIPEKENLKVGDRAKYLVKNPFPKSKALITLERYGVIKQWVQSFNTSTPIVEFDITEDLIPGFYLSVAIFSPRVSQLKGFDKLDLGKPTFKIGYVRVPIKDQYKDLVITTKTDKSVYKPREKVKVSVSAKERFPSRKKKPIEVAVAVLDESVFDLIKGGSSYYNPYWGFYDLGDLDVSNYSLLTRILGRQKFDKKGANQGGGGAGSFKMRSIFKYVSYWNPSLELKNGQANFEVTLPDNLTGWKIITMGVTPEDKMGLGESSFKVNRKTEIQAATPNQVTEGDEFVAAFTVMNRMEKTRKIKVTVIGAGDLDKEKNNLELTKELMIKPFKRELINFKVKASDVGQLRKNKHGEASFMVKAGDKYDQDALYHKFPVLKRRSLISAVAYGSSDSKKVNELIALPKNTHSDVGNISVTTAPTVLGTLEGSFNYLKEYPYNCWEQKLTKAVMASHYHSLKKYIDTKKVPWENSEKVIKEIILDATNFQAPNGAMVYYIPQNQYVSPYLSAYTALGFHWLKQAGHLIPNEVEEKLHSYLLQMLRKDIFPSYFNVMMISTVRSVALAALALEQKISEQEILRYESHFKNMSLFGKAHYLLAASVINGKSLHRIQKMASDDILSAATISAGKYSFNEVSNRTSHRILSSPLRSNCSILSAYVKYLKVSENKKHLKDIPYKIINYLTQSRKNRARWENTQENMFCMNAFVDYARNYENIEPNFKLSVKFAAKTVGESEVKSFRTPMQIYDYPFKKENIGKKEKLEFIKSGKGRFYYTTRVSYAPKDDFVKRQNAGIDIRKEYQVKRSGKWQKLNSPFKIKKGELIKVDIFISIPTARNFVVVNDPIPGGLEPINKDLATSSIVDLEDREFMGTSNSWFHKFRNWNTYGLSRWSFYHRELRNSAAVFYSEYLSPGNYYLSYNTQAIASGKFVSQPVHAEEMYNPDIFGKGVTGQFEVRE